VTAPGDVLNRRYQLLERLGEGGMGSVWQAYDAVLDRTVAAKELIADPYGAEPAAVRRERVRREALALAKVEHPAIVTIHDLIHVGSAKDPWIVMGYARGRPLSAIIREDPPLSEQRVAAIGRDVLAGLRACHEGSVYHRDVKPANIIVGGDGSVRLVDFGIARIVGTDTLTADSNIIGTLDYLAPEVLNGRPVGSASDLWALGVTLYYALTGSLPFPGETPAATVAGIFFKNPPEPRVGGRLASLVLQMLRKRQRDRPGGATVAEVLRDVAATGGQRSAGTGAPPRRTAPIQSAPIQAVPVQAVPVQTGAGQTLAAQAMAARTVARHEAAARQNGLSPPRQQASGPRRDARPIGPGRRLTPLYGMPVTNAAKLVAEWPTERAATALLSLGETQAANIVNQCEDPVSGRLLSAIAVDHPDRAGRILEMVTAERAGQLVDHMSSVTSAAALSTPPSGKAARILDRADIPTVVGALSDMSPRSAASVVLAMDEPRAVEVLGRASPATVAAILGNVPAADRNALLSQLPKRFRGRLGRPRSRRSAQKLRTGHPERAVYDSHTEHCRGESHTVRSG
jgi:serine/threonine protein kinase